MEPVPDLDVTPKTAQCTMSSGSKPMQLSSTSSKVVMPSGVKIMPQMTKIVVPVAPPVASAANPRIPTLGLFGVFGFCAVCLWLICLYRCWLYCVPSGVTVNGHAKFKSLFCFEIVLERF